MGVILRRKLATHNE